MIDCNLDDSHPTDVPINYIKYFLTTTYARTHTKILTRNKTIMPSLINELKNLPFMLYVWFYHILTFIYIPHLH